MTTEYKNPNIKSIAKDGEGFEILGQHDRMEFTMFKDEQRITETEELQLIQEVKDWMRERGHPDSSDKPYPCSRLADDIGESASVVSETLNRRYRGDKERILRKLDQHQADQRKQKGRFAFNKFALINLVTKAFGAINAGITNHSLPVVIMPPGAGKTSLALAFVKRRQGSYYLRCKNAPTDKRAVSEMLCQEIVELRPMKAKPHSRRLDSIISWCLKHRNAVFLVDEAQHLSSSGLECFRDIYDSSDPSGREGVTFAFLGDERFYSLILRAKSGETSPIAPQLVRRLLPLFDAVKDGCIDDDGGDLYSVDDILKVVNNSRVRLLTSDAARWATRLANVSGFGLIGLAIRVLELAASLMAKKGDVQITVTHCQLALGMTGGRAMAAEVDTASGGELLRKAVG